MSTQLEVRCGPGLQSSPVTPLLCDIEQVSAPLCSYPDERVWMDLGLRPLPVPTRLLPEVGNPGSCQARGPRPVGRGASALWARELPTSDSPFLHQFRTGRAGHRPAAQARNSGLSSRTRVHTARPESWLQTTTEVPRKETGKAPRTSLWGVGSRGKGGDADVQAPIPPSETSAVSCKATRAGGRGAG